MSGGRNACHPFSGSVIGKPYCSHIPKSLSVSLLLTILLIIIFTDIIYYLFKIYDSSIIYNIPEWGFLMLRLINRAPKSKSLQGMLDVVKCHHETGPHTLTCSWYRKSLCKILKIMLEGQGEVALRQRDNIVITDLCSPKTHPPDFTFIAVGKFPLHYARSSEKHRLHKMRPWHIWEYFSPQITEAKNVSWCVQHDFSQGCGNYPSPGWGLTPPHFPPGPHTSYCLQSTPSNMIFSERAAF